MQNDTPVLIKNEQHNLGVVGLILYNIALYFLYQNQYNYLRQKEMLCVEKFLS